MYRITVLGPGVTPDVYWESPAPGSFSASAFAEKAGLERQMLGSDPTCKPH